MDDGERSFLKTENIRLLKLIASLEAELTKSVQQLELANADLDLQRMWTAHWRAEVLALSGNRIFEPQSVTPRGFQMWAEFKDLYNEQFTVQESSSAEEHAVWVGGGGGRGHLSVEQARVVRDALTGFIQTSPDRFQ